MTPRILLVEKDLTTTDLLVHSLERKGYQVTVAHSRRDAASRIQTTQPDLLVMDVASFGPKGYDVSDSVRARLNKVPTILLLPQGHDSAGSSAEAFLTPPFTSRRLLYRVKKLASTLPDRGIRLGSLVLDPDTRTLRQGEATVRLRPKEAELLALFMRNPGQVLSRRQIMAEVWDTDYLEDTRTLNVHVCWLRAKIEGEPGIQCQLRTVRGVGYRFDAPQQETQSKGPRRSSQPEPEGHS